MYNNRQKGAINLLIIPIIVLSLAVIGSGAFAYWSYGKYQDFKKNTDQKIAVAVADERLKEQQRLEADFAEREKQPLRKFTGPGNFGSLSVMIPRTWNVYVDKDGSDGEFQAYFNPNVVWPTVDTTLDALHISITNEAYEEVLDNYESLLREGLLKATPVKMKAGDGMRLDGFFEDYMEGSKIVFRLRDKTVQLTAESKEYVDDFDNTILPNMTYIP